MDWTTVLVALIAAAAGFGGAWTTRGVTIRQVEAENERLRIQHREDHLRHRQAVYHDFLDAVKLFGRTLRKERFAAELPPGARADIDDVSVADAEAEYNRLSGAYVHAFNAALLFATPAVRAAVESLESERATLERLVDEGVAADIMLHPAREPFDHRFRRVWSNVDSERYRVAIVALVETMRQDVAPDVPRETFRY